MGLLNVDSLINNSTYLSSTKKFISSLDSAVGSSDSDVKPKYVYPKDIDRQTAANYMIIYIYDDKKNKTQFQPISTQIAKSKIQNDLVKQLTDCVSIKLTDKSKEALKKYKNVVNGKIKNWVKDYFKDFDFGKIDLGIETPEWIKDAGDFLRDNQLTRGVKDLIDAIDLPGLPNLHLENIDLPDFNLPDLKDYIDIKLDKDKLKSIVSDLKDKKTANNLASEAGEGFELITSVVLPLPTNGIEYSSKISIESTSTKTAQAIKSVIDAAVNANGVLSGLGSGTKQAYDVITAQGGELLYSMLGEGGSAIYQNKFGNIRDPLIAFTYSIPDPRTFEYDFLMSPRSKQELYDIWNMIKMLKFYSHMSIGRGGENSAVRYYNYPGRFKIKYYTEGNENIWLGKTKILGLTSIKSSIDTENIGFILNDFDNVSGNPPKIIGLSMTFTELSILNRDDINEGY